MPRPKKTTDNARPESDAAPTMRVQRLDSLALDPANPRAHGDRNKKTVRASLQRFGAGRSIVLNGNDVVVAGNATVEQARELGYTEVLVVEPQPGQLVAVRRPDWNSVESLAYAAVDNRAAEQADWDFPVLTRNLKAIEDAGFDLSDVGWEPLELASLFAPPVEPPTNKPDDGSHPVMGASVHLTADQRLIIDQAVERIRAMENNESISEGRCLELICADFMSGA